MQVISDDFFHFIIYSNTHDCFDPFQFHADVFIKKMQISLILKNLCQRALYEF